MSDVGSNTRAIMVLCWKGGISGEGNFQGAVETEWGGAKKGEDRE